MTTPKTGHPSLPLRALGWLLWLFSASALAQGAPDGARPRMGRPAGCGSR
jgi:hypothetical protein